MAMMLDVITDLFTPLLAAARNTETVPAQNIYGWRFKIQDICAAQL